MQIHRSLLQSLSLFHIWLVDPMHLLIITNDLKTGVIQEGIRLSFGVPGRLPRYAPTEDLVYAGYKLPRGVSLYLSTYYHNTDSSRLA